MDTSNHREEAETTMGLSNVAKLLGEAGLLERAPAGDADVRGISDDSRAVAPGDLFCAWAGTETDAHGFVAAAARSGAVAALVERPVADAAIPQVVVKDGRRAASVAAAALLEAAAGLRLVGVTGTNGKTTTAWILAHLVDAGAFVGTLGARRAGAAPLPGRESLTTPGPVELAGALRALRRAGAGTVALEMSSHALDQGRAHGLRLDVAVFTTFGRDHLDYHATEAAYRDAKLTLVDRLAADGAVVVNATEPAWEGVEARAARALHYALEEGGGDPAVARAQLRARGVAMGPDGAAFELVTPFGGAMTRVALPGRYNVENALAAAGAALALGMDVEVVAERLARVPQVPGRLERIADRPCPVLRDYAHTPDALENVLGAVRPLVAGRLILVFGAGGDRDRGKRPQMGAIAARLADVPIVTSDNPRTEDPESIIDDIVAGMDPTSLIRVADRRAAIARALEMARPADMVLLAGKGHETYQVVGRERRPFDEREVVRKLLEEGAA